MDMMGSVSSLLSVFHNFSYLLEGSIFYFIFTNCSDYKLKQEKTIQQNYMKGARLFDAKTIHIINTPTHLTCCIKYSYSLVFTS